MPHAHYRSLQSLHTNPCDLNAASSSSAVTIVRHTGSLGADRSPHMSLPDWPSPRLRTSSNGRSTELHFFRNVDGRDVPTFVARGSSPCRVEGVQRSARLLHRLWL